MRKGYLLTALAAVVLLAAFPRAASAQAELDVTFGVAGVQLVAPKSILEGDSEELAVSVRARGGTNVATDLTVTVTASGAMIPNTSTTAAETDAATDDYDLERGSTGVGVDGEVVTFTLTVPADAPYRVYEGTFFVDTHTDRDAEDENIALAIATNSFENDPPSRTVNVKIDDTDTQTYVMELPRRERPSEGDDFTVDIEADPAHVENMGMLTLQVVDEDGVRILDYTVSTEVAGSVIDSGKVNVATSAVVTISSPSNDGNRVPDTIALEAYAGVGTRATRVSSLDIDIADDHALPSGDAVTAVAMDKVRRGSKVTEVEEGGDPVYLTVTVDRGSGSTAKTKEALTIDLTVADAAQADDYDLTPTRVILPAVSSANDEQSTTEEIMLTARKNDDVGDETLTLNLTLSGEAKNGTETETGTFEITIADETEAVIEPKEQDEAYPAILDAIDAGAGDEGLNPGESFTVQMADLFTVMDGYTASYKASVSGDAVSISTSGDSLFVEAKSSGKAVVTVMGTAEAEMEASSFKSSQPSAYMADITFEVTVVDKALEALVVMLEMPANVMMGNIVEGESYDIMVSANRMVMEDTEVMIMRDRAASDADDSDFTVSSATIMAGYDSATAELMVTEDMMPDGGTNDNMGESLVLYGMVDGEETNSLTFTIWDQAVPALPLFGQLLLALFLMLGGARLYRRRQG